MKKALAIILTVIMSVFALGGCEWKKKPKGVVEKCSYVREGFIEFENWITFSGRMPNIIRLNVEENITINCKVDYGCFYVPEKYLFSEKCKEIEVQGKEIFY